MKHVEVAAALIFEKGKVFAVRRGVSPYPYLAHKFEFAGGKIEKGERGEDAVKRELKEELSLDIEVENLFSVTSFTYPDFSITLHLYECKMLSGFTLNEHEEYAFFSPEELKTDEWAPADAEVIGTIKRVFGKE